MTKKKLHVWITKYALTEGIFERDVEQGDVTPSLVTCDSGNGHWTEYYHGEGKDWHLTKAEAVKRAEAMRTKAILSAEKKIAKLKSLTF